MPYTLFDQASVQLNFLLNAQRQIIIVSAFSVALATFSENFNHPLMKYITLLMFTYAIAFGIKAVEDFRSFIEEAKTDEPPIDQNEKDLLNRWEKWIYFTYFLISIIFVLMLLFVRIDLFRYFKPKKAKK